MKSQDNKALKEIVKFLEEKANSIIEDKDLPIDDRVSQLDLILNTIKFLGDYDKNVEILNEYYYDNKYKQYHICKGENENESQQH